ncbi:GNAT family N-acetyltransferase [Mycolicibacterium bacteremicum]|uniref:GNAT family N-acetyltransferase n=1 Tax=Mycolicibacterium bacteremicum TaxID=564198 RepID=A0A1W9Z2N8_MYCBA|nr:GNAT family N-acetyltransferase [Mycolicibacterium bacteremicum]MCV7431986.1 GNAT family N-acetyltransferase [Mycolicibacterium bacteremicum]ORA06574.1 GNAT family N-acetyltransferase [Mycolicibacterium bacteremicum]
MAELTLRAVRDDSDFEAFNSALYSVFLEDPQTDNIRLSRRFTDLDRMFGFHDGTRWVSTAGDYRKQVMLPGGVAADVPAVTAVTVSPGYRRRGLLTQMMRHQLDTIRDRGTEALAMLFASETAIYGRFGYGMASQNAVLFGQVRDLDFRSDVDLGAGTVTETDAATVLAEGPAIHERAVTGLPGRMDRPRTWWDYQIFDNDERRKDSGSIRFALHREPDGTPSAIAIYRPKSEWNATGPNGELHIEEVRATNPRAYARIWRFLLEIDLVRRIKFNGAAVDEPLRLLVADSRALQCEVNDGIFVRLVDVARALALRRYATPIDMVLDVHDEFCPWNTGRYRLRGDTDGAQCEKTDGTADIAISVRDLGAGYLGGTSIAQLAAAGLVAELTPGAAHRAAVAFGWPVAPAIPDHF